MADERLPAYSEIACNGEDSEKTALLKSSPSESSHLSDHTHDTVRVSVAQDETPVIRTYWWRWLILAVFCLQLGSQTVAWITESPIADVITCYYGVDNEKVNWLSEMAIVTYVALVAPFTWFLHRFGLRTTMVMAGCANAFGLALIVIGSGADYFWFVLAGQGVASLTNVLIWGAPPLLSEVWFPPSERATATALGEGIASLSGGLIGLVLSPIIVHQKTSSFPSIPERDYNQSIVDLVCPNGTHVHPDQELFDSWSRVTHNQLFYWFLAQAVASVLILFLTVTVFRDAPPTPPSISRQLESKEEGWKQLKKSLKSLISANGVFFLMLLVTSGIMLSLSAAMSQVINEIIHPKFLNYDEQIAYLGLTMVVSGIVALVVFGRLLDYTKAFYFFNVILCVTGMLSLAILQVLIQFQHNFYWLYLAYGLIGITISGYIAISYEFAVEMTYPLPEALTGALVNLSGQGSNMFLVFLIGKYQTIGMWTALGFSVVAAVLSVFTRPTLRRVELEKSNTTDGSIQHHN